MKFLIALAVLVAVAAAAPQYGGELGDAQATVLRNENTVNPDSYQFK